MSKSGINEFFHLIVSLDLKKLRSKLAIKFGNRETLFTEIYKNNAWRSAESVSGPGSGIMATTNIRQQLPALFKKYLIETLSDAPCGDFHYMKEIDLDGLLYSGYDIVKKLVGRNNQLYAKAHIKFRHLDVVSQVLPSSDLILSRDMLIHFSFRDALQTIDNFRNSGSKYLLTNTYPGVQENADIKTGYWRPINLCIPPFNFEDPLDSILEFESPDGGKKYLSLFLLNA